MELKWTSVEIFDKDCDFGLFTLEYHSLAHILEDRQRLLSDICFREQPILAFRCLNATGLYSYFSDATHTNDGNGIVIYREFETALPYTKEEIHDKLIWRDE